MRMNGGQKAILCVAIGAVLVVVGLAAQALLWDDGLSGEGGWFNYAPNNGAIFSPDPMHDQNVALQAAMWIGLVVVWAGVCLLVLRDRTPAAPTDTGDAPTGSD